MRRVLKERPRVDLRVGYWGEGMNGEEHLTLFCFRRFKISARTRDGYVDIERRFVTLTIHLNLSASHPACHDPSHTPTSAA